MGHYRADMYATEKEWKDRHKLPPDKKFRLKKFRLVDIIKKAQEVKKNESL